jgi:hypothetical protein
MGYKSIWWTLSEVLERVKMATGDTEDEVKANICRGIADGAINFRGKLRKHITKPMISSAVLAGDRFEIPDEIKPGELDWPNSRPLKPLLVRRDRFEIPGHWELEQIMLSSCDVTNHLCGPGRQGVVNDSAASGRQPVLGSEDLSASGSARSRGPRPKKLQQTIDAMRNDIREGRRTAAELEAMLEKTLPANYGGVSRDTARKARNAVLSELNQNNLRQTATNDK